MERRDFLRSCLLACAGGAMVSVALASCKNVYSVTGTESDNKVKVAKTEFTDEKGAARGFILVRHTRLEFPVCIYKSGETYTALSTKCTHSGCEIQPNATSLVCPCHGSEFSNKGKVMNPPAEQDLKQYIVTTDNEYIYFQL
jgi:cytochrome b6-f complex iron-sulfur subunit